MSTGVGGLWDKLNLKWNKQLYSYFLEHAFAHCTLTMLCDLATLVHNIILDLHSNVLSYCSLVPYSVSVLRSTPILHEC